MMRPTHIPMPPAPYSGMNISYTPSPSSRDNPFESPLYSPNLVFYTAPSTPIVESPASQEPPLAPNSPALTSVMHISNIIPSSSQSPQFSLHNTYPPIPSSPTSMPPPEHIPHYPISPPTTDDSFPETSEPPDDTTLDDEGLSTLERIYLYSRSKSSFHRVFIANALPELLEQVTPHEAIEYVLPLLNTLAMDDDEMVKEAFSSRLVTIIWWFFTHCQLIPGDAVDVDGLNPPEFQDQESPPTISVQAFTPILGTLLLNPNALVGGATRYAVVALLGRIKRVNAMELNLGTSSPNIPAQIPPPPGHAQTIEGEDEDLVIGLFGSDERALFEKEIIYQVVVGMGRLDGGEEEEEGELVEEQQPRSMSDSSLDYSRRNQEPQAGFQISSPMREMSEAEGSVSRADVKQSMQNNNPYFPPLTSSSKVTSIQTTSNGSPMSTSSSDSSSSTPSSTTSTTASSSSEDSVSPSSNPSARPSQSSSSSSSNSTITSPGMADPSTTDPTPAPFDHSPSLPIINSHQSDIHAFSSISDRLWPISPSYSPQQDASAYGALSLPSAGIPDTPSPPSSNFSDVQSYDSVEFDEEGEYDQAAIGRLSSMSLVAAVAASGFLDEASTDAFVAEVERVSQDPLFWVRKEACFALGALAKMRTLQNLVTDPMHNVRHSSLFALPTILGRLPSSQRRQTALDILIPMSMDESADVRAGVLEALGEVIYTFHEDENLNTTHDFADAKIKESQTPPEELLKMFLGRTHDRRVIDGQQPLASEEEDTGPLPPITNKQAALEAFYTDPSRPLICAFNFPAVTLTVGRNHWSSLLRDTYLWLSGNNTPGVKRTLAASLGEMAKILGEEYAQQDLLGVWRSAFRTSDDEVRLKLIDCLVTFVGALPRVGQLEVFNALLDAWSSAAFTSWREREGIAKSLNDLLNVGGSEVMGIIEKLLMHSLADSVNTVREAAISILPKLWMTFKGKGFLDSVRSDLLSMAQSELSRRRMTYIACQHALLIPGPEGVPSMEIDDELCHTLASLASDYIVGVRIGVARLIAFICGELTKKAKPVPKSFLDVIPLLSQDSSHEVRSYVVDCLVEPRDSSNSSGRYPGLTRVNLASTASTFSRPPSTSRGHSAVVAPWLERMQWAHQVVRNAFDV
ncbi:ARM repeat-containing protein [Gymnopus androsaceus JB14]|uniref:ARM repeat-containing protein n=1 Tax=Gymnopus androsaceus JB14 TaxID=1447944 RepID=A0A6A4HQL0_9AGAR|nr:ARM repeat-containing protein [Gymnopus androsaceus JB14]